MADAIIIETYGQCVQNQDFRGHRLALVTHNKDDFSDPTGSDKTPHPDFASYFSKRKSLYFISLAEAIQKLNPELVSDLMLEQEWNQEPRPLSEILDALHELLEKRWYQHHKQLEHDIKSGKIKIVEKETFPVKDHRTRPVQRDVWEGACKSAVRVERKYGKKNLGAWDDYEYGMVNGKVSALRWALGMNGTCWTTDYIGNLQSEPSIMGIFDRLFSKSPNKDKFAQAVLDGIKRAGEQRAVVYDRDHFALRTPDKNGEFFNLGNAYPEFCAAPKAMRPEAVKKWVRVWFRASRGDSRGLRGCSSRLAAHRPGPFPLRVGRSANAGRRAGKAQSALLHFR